MMVVISNTSPLTNLAAVGQFYLLHQLYGRLWIAEAVWQELNAGGQSWPGRDEVAGAVWITRQAATNRPLVTTLREHLDHGEAETNRIDQSRPYYPLGEVEIADGRGLSTDRAAR